MHDYLRLRRPSSNRLPQLFASLIAAFTLPALGEEPGYRLPPVDLHEKVIWGATCEGPDGIGLKFGGEDQSSDDGCGHTQIRRDGKWVDIYHELQSLNVFQSQHDRCVAIARRQKDINAQVRRMFFDDQPIGAEAPSEKKKGDADADGRDVAGRQIELARNLDQLLKSFNHDLPKDTSMYDLARRTGAQQEIPLAIEEAKQLAALPAGRIRSGRIARMRAMQVLLEEIAEGLDCEPAPRALSPIVYEAKSNCFVLFGGDHGDYLTNDTWVFDRTLSTWRLLPRSMAPSARANHSLTASGDGLVVLSGGYTYTSTTDYMGGQYRDLNDGAVTCDVVHGHWSWLRGESSHDDPGRVYRTGPFLPDYFMGGTWPNAESFAKQLKSLPPNTWLYTAPPQLPKMNRDWGSAVIDADHDLILRFSGGHCAHGGTDVLQFHLATNRWELPFPVEFPLGQLYSNTSYPQGWNFNHRPWVTGHTYQSYGYDGALKKMLFLGQTQFAYVWDPEVADWTQRFEKPRGMAYDSCYYTLTVCSGPHGLICWTHDGDVFQFDAAKHAWNRIETHGAKLPGSEVDNSTVAYDARRDRLLFVRKSYGDTNTFNGEVQSLSLKTGEVTKLTPGGSAAAAKIPYLCHLRYDAEHDLLLVGATLPPDASGLRRTPAYDCAGNRWVSLRIGGDDPSGPIGRNVSLGLMYDAKRKLFWAVDTNSKVFVLRLDPATADLRPL